MLSNAKAAMEPSFDVNLAMRLLRIIDVSWVISVY